MFEFKQGNLFDTKYDLIAHGCNCFHTFGSGVALEVKKRYPAAYAVDLQTKRGDIAKLGTYSWTKIPSSGLYILNLYTQFDYGRDLGRMYVNWSAVDSVFYKMKEFISWQNSLGANIQRIGMPLIGCGLGGGLRKDLETLAIKHFISVEQRYEFRFFGA